MTRGPHLGPSVRPIRRSISFNAFKRSAGWKARPDLRNGIDEPGLIPGSYRLRPVEGRAAEEPDPRNLRQQSDRRPARLGRPSHIGADPDEGNNTADLSVLRTWTPHPDLRYVCLRPRTSCMS